MSWLLARLSTAPTMEYYAVIQHAQCWWATTCDFRDEESNPSPPGSEASTLPLGHLPSLHAEIALSRTQTNSKHTTSIIALIENDFFKNEFLTYNLSLFRVTRTLELRTRGVSAAIRMVDTERVAVATLFVKETPRRSAGVLCSTLL